MTARPLFAVAALLMCWSPASAQPSAQTTKSAQTLAAAKARAVFDRHCARCHQSSRHEKPVSQSTFDGILDLETLATRHDLIKPGEPDASRLYQAMLTRHMPSDVYIARTRNGGPTPRDVEAVRDWITGLPPRPACETRARKRQNITSRIETWMRGQADKTLRDTRFVTLNDPSPACRFNRQLDAQRAGLLAVLNSLSWKRDSASAIKPIDEPGDIYAINLRALGWSSDIWRRLARLTNKEARPWNVQALPLAMHEATDAETPVLRADIMAAVLQRPWIYAEILQLPDTRRVFEAMLEWRLGRSSPPIYAGVKKSKVTGGSRLVSRKAHISPAYAWWVEDGRSNADTLNQLYGKRDRTASSTGNPSRVLFRLPNGFMAAAAFDAGGGRIEILNSPDAPESSGNKSDVIAHEPAGFSCLSCHGGGALPFDDQLSPKVSRKKSDASTNANLLGDTLTDVVSDDHFDVVAAHAEAGIGAISDRTFGAAVGALLSAYARPLDLKKAASELGVQQNELRARLRQIDGALKPVARRLLTGLITRDELNDLSVFLRPTRVAALDPSPAPTTSSTSDDTVGANASNAVAPLGLSLWTEQATYARGDKAVFFAAADRPCNLTLINVDTRGAATVLFPNEFHTKNAVEPGQIIQVPPPGSPYTLNFAATGKEQLVGICMEGERTFPPAIRPNYERQRFTLLGDWRNHLIAYLEAEAKERANVGKKRKRKRRSRRRRRGTPPPVRESRDPLPQLRASITIKVE